MADYSEEIALALELIEEFGELSTLVRTVSGTPADPDKPWVPGEPEVTETPVHAVYATESVLRRSSLAKQGEVFVILPAAELDSEPDPSTDQLVRANGARHAIISVDVVSPSGDPIIYEVKASS